MLWRGDRKETRLEVRESHEEGLQYLVQEMMGPKVEQQQLGRREVDEFKVKDKGTQ